MNDVLTLVEMHPAPATSGLIVFGRDNSGKPRASRFNPADAELAERAAGVMGLRVLKLSAEQASLAGDLPMGRILASGRAFVPCIKAAAFAKLDAARRTHIPPQPSEPETSVAGLAKSKGAGWAITMAHPPVDGPNAFSSPAEPPFDWGDISEGHAVLAAEDGDTNTGISQSSSGKRATICFSFDGVASGPPNLCSFVAVNT